MGGEEAEQLRGQDRLHARQPLVQEDSNVRNVDTAASTAANLTKKGSIGMLHA